MSLYTLIVNNAFSFSDQFLNPVLVFLTAMLVAKYYFALHKGKQLPPGPWCIPFIGYLPWVTEPPLPNKIHQLTKRYGPILRVKSGPNTVVYLSNLASIKEAFWKEEFSDRPTSGVYEMFDGYGVTNSVGQLWKTERRFVHGQLQKLGMTVRAHAAGDMEKRIMTELNPFLETLKGFKGEPINIANHIRHITTNVLSNILMATRFERDHPFYKRIEELHESGFALFGKADFYCHFPFMTMLPGYKNAMGQLKANRNEEMDLIKFFIEEKRRNFDPSIEKTSLIDGYLHKEYNDELEGKEINVTKDHDSQLCQVIIDLYSGGSETVQTALIWAFLFLLHNKKVIKKIQEELDVVVGRSRLPTFDDRQFLPYTQATIYEALRLSNVVPMAAAHAARSDTTVGGYFIPKGTTVMSNLYTCHLDSNVWPNPEIFDPMRFINDQGRVYKPNGFIPFGLGKRMCLAEILGNCELFLTISCILHVFDMEHVAEKPLPSLEGIIGPVVTVPKPYELRFVERDDPVSEIRSSHQQEATRGI